MKSRRVTFKLPRKSRPGAKRKSPGAKRKSPGAKRKSPSRKTRSRKTHKVRIPITNTGSLTSLGYSMSFFRDERRKALTKAVKKYGYKSVMAKVNTLYVYNMNSNPKTALKAESDKKWLREKYYAGRSRKVRSTRKDKAVYKKLQVLSRKLKVKKTAVARVSTVELKPGRKRNKLKILLLF